MKSRIGNNLKFRKCNNPILSINEVFIFSLKYLNEYFKENENNTISFLIANMYGSIDCYYLWRKILKEHLNLRDRFTHTENNLFFKLVFENPSYNEICLGECESFFLMINFFKLYFKNNLDKKLKEIKNDSIFNLRSFISNVSETQKCESFEIIIKEHITEKIRLEEKNKNISKNKMKFREYIPGKEGDLGEHKYSDKKKLSAYNAYMAMLMFIDKYFYEKYPEEETNELVSRMQFMGNDTHYAECWELWEEVLNDLFYELSIEKLFNFIKSKLSINDIVSEYVQLKSVGKKLRGTCPLCLRDNVFSIYLDEQYSYCSSCYKGGDLISFIAQVKNLSKLEAAKYLIDKYQLQVPNEIQNADFFKKIMGDSN